MNGCPDFTHLLVLPRLRVQNANAISSPLTHGFPAMTAFLGLMWALERKANASGLKHLAFNAVGVVSHGWQELVTEGYLRTFRLTRNPLDKGGGSAGIVEEGRIHLDLSLIFAVRIDEWDDARSVTDLQLLAELVAGLRIAGGTVLPKEAGARGRLPWWIDMRGDAWQTRFRNLCVRLLPGSALVAREELLDQRFADLQAEDATATRLDAWLSLARVDWTYDKLDGKGAGKWIPSRSKGDGWLVPIPVGYGAISELHAADSVPNTRDRTTPFRFVESLYSVGEWIGTHRFQIPQDLLWYADCRSDEGLYRCRNDYRPRRQSRPPLV